MHNGIKIGLSYLGAAIWWVFDKAYGDAIFQGLRTMSAEPLAPVLTFLLHYGPPMFLVALGTYFWWTSRSKTEPETEEPRRVGDLNVKMGDRNKVGDIGHRN